MKARQILEKIEKRGLKIDVRVLDEMIESLEYLDQQREALAEEIGADPWQRNLFGLKSTARAVLLRSGIPGAKKVAEFRVKHRHLQDLRSLRKKVEDGVFKFEWKEAKTGRFYATGGILTKSRDCRKAVVPWKGEKFYSYDYVSQELRIIAAFTRNRKLLQLLDNGGVHEETAKVLGISRKEAKTVNYAYMYGMEVEALQRIYGITDEQMTEIESYLPMQKLRQVARKRVKGFPELKVQTLFGRWIEFDPEDEKTLVSYMVQGSGADILRRGLRKMAKKGVLPTIVVHDNFLLEEKVPGIKEELEFEFKGVKFPVKIKEGANWAEVTD